MPIIQPDAPFDVGHGIGGGQASINNRAFSRGGFGGWLDPGVVAFIDGTTDAWIASDYHVATGARASLFDPPVVVNTLQAGGGVAAGHNAGRGDDRGLWSTTGLRLPDAGLLGVGPGGEIGYKPDYQADGPSRVHERTGDDWQLTTGHASDLQLLGDGRAVWREGDRLRVANLPSLASVAGGIWKPCAAFAGADWWISYYSDLYGILLHRFASADYGYSILPRGDGWQTIAAVGPETIRIAIATHEGEQPGELWGYDLNVRTGAATPLPFWPDGKPTVFAWVEIATINAPPVIEPPPIEPPVEPPVEPPIEPPIEPEPVPPNPEPPPVTEDETMIAYASKPMPGFLAGELVDNGNGTVSVLKPNGKYLAVTPDGKVEERDTPGGAWESFRKSKGSLIAERDGEAKGPLVYVLAFAE